MIRLERDTHGRTYQIWQQQQENSCGVACTWMARGIARQASFAEDEWDLAVRMYLGAVAGTLGRLGVSPSGPMSLDPRAYPSDQTTMANTLASFGLYGAQVATGLRNEGLTVTHTTLSGTPPKIRHEKIAYNKPAIVLVGWDGGGGHFLVVGRCTVHDVSFLDPWNGHVNQQSNNGRYLAQYNNSGSILEIIYISA